VADVLAVHHVDHVLADILGMIADALQRAHDPHDIERAPDGARILHHEGDALALDRLVFLIDDCGLARGLSASQRIHAREGVEHRAPSARHGAAEVLDLAVLVGRPLHGGQARGDVADLLASSPMRSRSVMVLMIATTMRRSPAAGARVARMRLHSSSIDTSMPLTL
jgi:hypothetical protein